MLDLDFKVMVEEMLNNDPALVLMCRYPMTMNQEAAWRIGSGFFILRTLTRQEKHLEQYISRALWHYHRNARVFKFNGGIILDWRWSPVISLPRSIRDTANVNYVI